MFDFKEFELKIAEFSRNITQALKNEDWQKLSDILQNRQIMLEQFLAEPIAENEKERVIMLIKKIQQDDSVFAGKVKLQQKDVESKMQRMKKGRQSVQLYVDTE